MRPGPSRKTLGETAERAALRFLESNAYRILARNFSTPHGEVDIIAAENDTLCFIEVRSRTSDDDAPPYASVTAPKQRRVRAAAGAFLRLKHSPQALCRFDVLSLVPSPESTSGWDITLLRDAF